MSTKKTSKFWKTPKAMVGLAFIISVTGLKSQVDDFFDIDIQKQIPQYDVHLNSVGDYDDK
jgi:hypothetical protein